MPRGRKPPADEQTEDFSEADDESHTVDYGAILEAQRQQQRERAQAQIGDIAVLEDEEYQDVKWAVYRVRTDYEQRADPEGNKRADVGRMMGPIDGDDFRTRFGGGTFYLIGRKQRYDDQNRRRGQIVLPEVGPITIEGPRKDFSRPDVMGPPLPGVAVNGNGSPPVPKETHPDQPTRRERILLRELKQMRLEREAERQQAQREREAAERERIAQAERDRVNAQIAELKNMIQAQAVALNAAASVQPAKSEKLTDLVAALVSLKSLDGGGVDQLKLLELVRGAFTQGLTLGQDREPITADDKDPNDWAPVVKTIAEVLGRAMASQQHHRQPVPPAHATSPGKQPSSPPRTPSEATVVQEPNSSPAPSQGDPTQPAPSSRWAASIEAVARGFAAGTHPDTIATALEALLSEEELANLVGQQVNGLWQPTPGQILGWLKSPPPIGPGLGSFPQLESAGGIVYLESVLASLRTPADDEDEAPEA